MSPHVKDTSPGCKAVPHSDHDAALIDARYDRPPEMTAINIAIIPGDGVGREVAEAAWEVSLAGAGRCGVALSGTTFPWSCEYYLQHGHMMPEDGIEILRPFDAILLGAIGWPAKVPDDVSLHGLLLRIRKEFDLYANIRPNRLLPGITGPLRSDVVYPREHGG
jgi:tartrate dehydrogenase/decarboxylase/D-malate dehydrogenase